MVLLSILDSVSDTESNILKSASFNLSGSVVLLTCEFKEGVAGASCVLVYREYGNETVVVVEYPQSTDFPVTVTVDDNLENYTFAVFGKDGSSVDERPVITERLSVIMASTPPTTTATTVSTTSGIMCYSLHSGRVTYARVLKKCTRSCKNEWWK